MKATTQVVLKAYWKLACFDMSKINKVALTDKFSKKSCFTPQTCSPSSHYLNGLRCVPSAAVEVHVDCGNSSCPAL